MKHIILHIPDEHHMIVDAELRDLLWSLKDRGLATFADGRPAPDIDAELWIGHKPDIEPPPVQGPLGLLPATARAAEHWTARLKEHYPGTHIGRQS